MYQFFFAGLLLGSRFNNKLFLLGLIAGGIGSAIADIIGGFAIFAPITFLAKGFEGGLVALASKKTKIVKYTLLILGGITMVSIYFISEIMMPNFGIQLALQEVLPNLVQAGGGLIGGILIFEAYNRISSDE